MALQRQGFGWKRWSRQWLCALVESGASTIGLINLDAKDWVWVEDMTTGKIIAGELPHTPVKN